MSGADSPALRVFTPALLADDTLDEAPIGVTFSGALLFADIAGFTPLTERLAESGAEGSETLSALLTDYFGALIDIVLDGGGDVWALAGDALLAVWPGDEVGAVRGAATAALQAQQALAEHRTPFGEPITTRIAIAPGELTLELLGAHDGRVTMRSAVAARVGADGEPASGHPGVVQINAVPATDVVDLRPRLGAAPERLVPEVVRSHIGAGRADWLAEFRPIHVAFINLDGFLGLGLGERHELVRALQGVIVATGGQVFRFLVDDKGATAIAGYGLPGGVDDRGAVRSVELAMRAQQVLVDHGIRGGIGVASGRGFVGPVGSARRAQYSVNGMVMNRAARLMQRAVGECGDVPDATRYKFAAIFNHFLFCYL